MILKIEFKGGNVKYVNTNDVAFTKEEIIFDINGTKEERFLSIINNVWLNGNIVYEKGKFYE